MQYDKYTIETVTTAEDLIIGTLYDLGIEGAQIEDKVPLTEEEKKGMFVDIPLMPEEDDGVAYVTFFLESGEDHTQILEEVKKELAEMSEYMELGSLKITSGQTKDEDFLNNWKQFFHQFYIDDILFIPSWEEDQKEQESGMTIHIDPGTAFGTGMHETTQLCIRALRKYIKGGEKVLDVGTGSGILAIMSYKFGAGEVIGTDLDVCAIDATADNMEANGLGEAGFELIIGNIIDDTSVQDEVGYECCEIVAANILAEVLVPLTPQVKKHLKVGGIYITSGIIDDKEETVVKALSESGFEVLEINHMGEWVGIVARKNA